MKIAVITLQGVKNYGSVLQAYATQEKFKEMGYEVEIINYIREDCLDKNIIKTWTEKDFGIKKILKSIVLYPTIQKWKRVFGNFLNENVNLTKTRYVKEEDFIKNMPLADIYCTGSDQVWNSGWNKGIEKPLFLSFVPDDKPKISFAASFGKSNLDDWEIEETKRLLNRYDAISVRESSGVDIVNDLGIKDVTHILDPTLMLDKDYWSNISSKRIIKDDYVLIYQLNTNKEFDNYVNKFAKRKGLKIVRLCTRYDQIFKSGHSVVIPEVLDFVSLFKYSSCVITDSFHATAFSLNLNKEFISIYPNEYGGRIDSILKLTNLQNRHLKDYNDLCIADDKIDFTEANIILENERKKFNKYIDDALMKVKEKIC